MSVVKSSLQQLHMCIFSPCKWFNLSVSCPSDPACLPQTPQRRNRSRAPQTFKLHRSDKSRLVAFTQTPTTRTGGTCKRLWAVIFKSSFPSCPVNTHSHTPQIKCEILACLSSCIGLRNSLKGSRGKGKKVKSTLRKSKPQSRACWMDDAK